METKRIKLLNVDKDEITDGTLFYKDYGNFKQYIKIVFKDIEEESTNENYFEALKDIRFKIYPWIPMLKGSLINAISRGSSVVYLVDLNKVVSSKDIYKPFEETSDKKGLVHPLLQQSFREKWFNKSQDICKEYGIIERYICIEKVPKYSFIYNDTKEKLEKITNKN